MYQHHQILR